MFPYVCRFHHFPLFSCQLLDRKSLEALLLQKANKYRCDRVCSISVLGDPSDQSKESSEMVQYQQQSRRIINGKMYEEICADSLNNDIS